MACLQSSKSFLKMKITLLQIRRRGLSLVVVKGLRVVAAMNMPIVLIIRD